MSVHAQRYLLAGILTIVPLWITWMVFDFILSQLSRAGTPWVRAFSKTIHPHAPTIAEIITQPWVHSAIAAVLTLIGLYVLGWATTRVIGKRLLKIFDALMERIPLVQKIYGATKRLVSALQSKPGNVRRVVLIDFPNPNMKTVGLVTRTITDAKTGRQLAAVYVPTTPNPTSGYLEIVPLDQLVATDWTLDEAMTFIISGGAVAPDTLNYSGEAPPAVTPATDRGPASTPGTD